jgi:transcriptional regulator of arginine metabolism
MPAKPSVQQRRREAILEILMGDEAVPQQKDFVNLLRERGIPATQSSVSRDLADIGAVRIGESWVIPDWVGIVSPFEKVIGFVKEVKSAGPYQTLIVTAPGAAGVVAQAIDSSEWEDVVGTVAGLSSVLVLTEGAFFQKLLFMRLNRYMEESEEKRMDAVRKAAEQIPE